MDDQYQEFIELANNARWALATLTPREEIVLRKRFGIGDHLFTQEEIASQLSVTQKQISRIEISALNKLRRPFIAERLRELTKKYKTEITPQTALQDVVETVDSLTFELMKHLKNHREDIEKIPWDVFEHLIAEFLASQGFIDVRLVGRDSSTSADIYATLLNDSIGTKIRFFIEVKREKKKVGINIINSIVGAISLEKSKYGWHAGLIVSVSGFQKFKKHTKTELKLKGVELKDRQDLFTWLENYKPNKDGLWLPDPKKKMPQLTELIQ